MTHQPPLPAASTAPYPSHPASPENLREQPAEQRNEIVETHETEGIRAVSARRFGIGAAVGIGSAAIAAALLYVRGKGGMGATGRNAKKGGEKRKHSSDDKGKRGEADRSRVAAGEQYEVSYFARRHKITAAQAREIIAEAGSDREAANRLAERRKQS